MRHAPRGPIRLPEHDFIAGTASVSLSWADTFTAGRRATAMLYQDTVAQAQVLAYADEFWLLSTFFFAIVLVLPFMRRIRTEPGPSSAESRVEGLPAAE